MKKIFLICVLLVFFFSLFAHTVPKQEINKVLNNFLKYKNKTDYSAISQKLISNSKNEVIAYIFQLKPSGFVAITSDNDLIPVISYSFTNNLITDNDNLIYEMILKDIELRLKYSPDDLRNKNRVLWNQFIYSVKDNRDFQQWPAEGSTDTDGWVETTWNQSGVFNRFCPLDGPYERSVVGCVATAMSMIIDFHHYVGNVQFSDADDYVSGWNDEMHIDDDHEERDYPAFPELNNYLITLNEHYENGIPLTNDDKSALCFAAGIATHMIYGADGSGTWVSEVQTALLNKFGFSSADYVDDINNQFYTNLADNMKTMKPAELAIYTSGWHNGHAIICDGYNTDNYYHLNYGWGTSNNTCWYSLPEGMPYNYSILANAVINIEGGDVPTYLSGNINMEGDSPVGTYVKFEGDKIYEAYVNTSNGNYIIPAIEPGNYVATAIKEAENLYYDSFEVQISGNAQTVNFDMAIYNALQGHISSSTDPTGTNILIYKDDELMYQAQCNNSDGIFSIPNVLPGNYVATASLPGNNLFAVQPFEVNAQSQEVNIELTSYPKNLQMGYHSYVEDKWHLINNYTISCGIKLTSEELSANINNPVAKVTFLSPISTEQGEISIQLWENNTLLEERSLDNFSENEWITAYFPNYHLLDPNKAYYVGYKINSTNGYIAFYDNGPQIENYGAYLHTTSWNKVPPNSLNKNFCIEAGFISQNSSSVTGTISTNDNYTALDKGIILTDRYYITHCNSNGDYVLQLNAGTYDITAFLPEHLHQTIQNIQVSENDVLSDVNFFLEYGTEATDENNLPTSNLSVISYPNPFYLNKTSKKAIRFKITGKSDNPTIKIYNLKGQLIKTLNHYTEKTFTWNIKNEIKSGIYFYQLKNNDRIIKTNKIIIIK